MAGWSLLQEDIVELIAKKLTFILDFTRFSAVCRSWKLDESKRKRLLAPQLPLLMLIEGVKDGGMTCNYYSLPEDKIFEFKLPEAHGNRCVGSTDGWVVTVDECFKMQLLNPFTGAQIQLPSQATFEDQYPEDDFTQEELCDLTVSKAILSSNPSSSNNECVVLAIHGYWRSLGFARPGDEAWTPVKSKILFFEDAIYYKGNFYAINATEGVFLVDIGIKPKTKRIARPVREASDCDIGYLVEWCGELLQVLRMMEDLDPDGPEHRTLGFRVFKLDFSKKKWEEVKSLGHHALFLGWNTSISLTAANFHGIKENCIYFSDVTYSCYFTSEILLEKDIGIFHMKDESIEPLHTGQTYRFPAPPLWVIPNPWN
ncbi:F-box protein At2g26160-like [Telopea speciosissima]|uniref:F-box protein At2g26160-like n=1 Tax=Telopea speciosissima TaxID=54955 RepID=UPI001CC601B3|nr:F-box protein At2g26160-like [Telopea speciosissima]